jgi:type I restriction enzyme S subunit
LLAPTMERLAPATTLPILSKSKFEGLSIPVPPLDQQRRIAAILDRANELRRKRRRTLSGLQSLANSVFRGMFGPINSLDCSWPVVPLGEVMRESKIGLVRAATEFGEGLRYSYVRMNAIQRDGRIDHSVIKTTNASDREAKEYALDPRDFLFNTRNSKELVGKVGLWNGQAGALFNNNIMRIRFVDNLNPLFALWAFFTPLVRQEIEIRKSGTTSVFAIYAKDLKTLPFPMPPIELQETFSKRMSTIRTIDERCEQSMLDLETLFAALRHRAFNGEL